MSYHVSLTLRRGEDREISESSRKAISDRIRSFAAVGARDRLKIFEMSGDWSMKILLIGRQHAIIGFPQDATSNKLEYGLRVSGAALVDAMVDWYDSCVERPSTEVDLDQFVVGAA